MEHRLVHACTAFAEHTLERGTVSPVGMIEGVIEHDVKHTDQLRSWLEERKARTP